MYRIFAFLLISFVFVGCAKKDSFNIRNVDPGQEGTVRSLSAESQDAIRIASQMSRSLLESPVIAESEFPPTIVMLPMENNTRFPFNKDVFTTRLKAELNTTSNGKMRFVSRDLAEDVNTERELKRDGVVDYDPNRRTRTTAGADFLLKGQVVGLSTRSGQGTAEYSLYTFKLVDAETAIELWEDLYEVKKEGKDDVIYQ